MPITIRQFVEQRGPQQLITIRQRDPIKAALELMVMNDFTLLPVVDSSGLLSGIISEQSVMRTYYHADGMVNLLQLPVAHCEEDARTIKYSDRLAMALRLLEDSYAVIIVEDDKPQRIITDYDTNRFFRDFSEDLIKVEKIEGQLRTYLEAVFPDEKSRKDAARIAKKEFARTERRTGESSDWLQFIDYIRIIDNDKNWPYFSSAFESRDLFYYLIDQVRRIRNQLAHFDERPSAAQRDVLQRAFRWIENRPVLPPIGDATE
jgi:CBS domain-containing protein